MVYKFYYNKDKKKKKVKISTVFLTLLEKKERQKALLGRIK